jgi:hypothetical protein
LRSNVGVGGLAIIDFELKPALSLSRERLRERALKHVVIECPNRYSKVFKALSGKDIRGEARGIAR